MADPARPRLLRSLAGDGYSGVNVTYPFKQSVIPLLDELLSLAAKAGVEDAVLGMAHRGRLNVLSNIIGDPETGAMAERIFTGAISALSERLLASNATIIRDWVFIGLSD